MYIDTHTYIYIYICIYTYIYTLIQTHVHIHTKKHIYTHIHTLAQLYIYTYICNKEVQKHLDPTTPTHIHVSTHAAATRDL